MSFFGGIFRALGFESEETEVKPKKKVKKVEQKAAFNLKKDKIEENILNILLPEGVEIE